MQTQSVLCRFWCRKKIELLEGLREFQIDGVYVIHALKGYELHAERIEKLFAENSIDFEFVTDGDPSLATDEDHKKYFTPDIDAVLSKGVKSCTLNHIYAYRKMVERNDRYAIVFENDPCFIGDFRTHLAKIKEEMLSLSNGFLLSIENTTFRFPSYWQTKAGKKLYRANMGRAAGAYIIDLTAAKAILSDLETTKCHTVIDWWHNSLIEREVVREYWSHPAFVEQASHNGMLSSTISTAGKGLSRKIKWKTVMFYRRYFSRLKNCDRIIED